MPPAERRIDAMLGSALGVAFFLLYWAGHSLTFGPGDSPQHVLSGIVWGVSWPPSYPLYVALSHLAAILAGNPASNVNGLSCVLHAATVSMLFLLLRRCELRRWPSVTAATLMGLAPLFWYHSLIAEVRALNDLLAVSGAYALVAYTRAPSRKLLVALGIALGLGIGHHPTFLLIAPAVGYWLSIHRRQLHGADWVVLALTSAVFCAAPYLILGLRLELGQPAYNLTGAERSRDVFDLFTRRSLGGPLRMVAGGGLFGPEGFDFARLRQHLGWFADASARELGFVGLPLATIGFLASRRRRPELFIFWSIWLAGTALPPLVLGSQQLHLHDLDFAYSVAVRFYLLPLIAVFVWAGEGIDALANIWPSPACMPVLFSLAALAGALHPISVRGRDFVSDYAREIVAESRPNDMIVIDTDATFFALEYLDVVENSLGDRVVLAPSLFNFPPYLRWLARRYPTLGIPIPGTMMDWRNWMLLNPSRGLLAEAEWKEPLLAMLPASKPAGAMIRGCGEPAACEDAGTTYAAFLSSPALTRISRSGLFRFSLDVYVLRHYQAMLDWSRQSEEPGSPLSRRTQEAFASLSR